MYYNCTVSLSKFIIVCLCCTDYYLLLSLEKTNTEQWCQSKSHMTVILAHSNIKVGPPLLIRPNSLNKFNQLLDTRLLPDCYDPYWTSSAKSTCTWSLPELDPTSNWVSLYSSRSLVEVEMIVYWFVKINYIFHPNQTKALHDHFPINSTSSRPIPDHFPISSWPLGLSVLARIFLMFQIFLG